MDLPEVILAVISVAVAAGGIAALFYKGASKGNRDLLESNIVQYQNSEKLKDQRITYLEAQVYEKDQIIKRLTSEPK